MKSIINTRVAFIFLLVSTLVACSEYEDHFDNKDTEALQKMSVGEYLESSSEYAYFSDLLKKQGYFDSVSGTRPVTVFLPEKVALDAYDVSEDSMKSILAYHIGNTLLFGSQMDKEDEVLVKSLYKGKSVWVRKGGSGSYELDRAVACEAKPVICTNGLVYKLTGALTPKENLFSNIWKKGDDFSAYKKMVLKDSMLFDRKNSYPIGVDKFGRQVYDSVFVRDYVFLKEVSDISDEKIMYTSVMLSDEALNATKDRLMKRYFGSLENVPTYAKGKEYEERLERFILRSSIVQGEPDLKLGDTLTTTFGWKVIIDDNWLEASRKRLSNGFLFELPSVDMLLGPIVGRPATFDASVFTFLKYDTERADIQAGVIASDGKLALSMKAEKPFAFEITMEDVMSGKFVLMVSGLRTESSQASMVLGGEEIAKRYTPSGNWNYDRFEDVYFDAFGDKVIRFEVNEPDAEGAYSMAINEFILIPVRE